MMHDSIQKWIVFLILLQLCMLFFYNCLSSHQSDGSDVSSLAFQGEVSNNTEHGKIFILNVKMNPKDILNWNREEGVIRTPSGKQRTTQVGRMLLYILHVYHQMHQPSWWTQYSSQYRSHHHLLKPFALYILRLIFIFTQSSKSLKYI